MDYITDSALKLIREAQEELAKRSGMFIDLNIPSEIEIELQQSGDDSNDII